MYLSFDGEQSPLYKMGFDRVGCFPCLAGGDYWKAKRLLLMILAKANVLKLQLAHEVKKNVFTSMKWSRKIWI